MALLIALWMVGCAAESASAPSTSTQPTVEAPVSVAGQITPAVPSALPTGLSIPSLGLTTSVHEMKASECPVLNPPTVDEAYWVGCRAKPGTDSDGTVFIIGHAVVGGQGVFKNLQHLALDSDVIVTTPTGTLTYRVERTVVYAKFGEIQDSPEVMEKVPGRLVLVTCLLGPGGEATDENFVAQAKLVSSANS